VPTIRSENRNGEVSTAQAWRRHGVCPRFRLHGHEFRVNNMICISPTETCIVLMACISYTSFGGYDDKASAEVLTRAADLGINFWDTSDVYGPHTNERLIGKWFKDTGRRKEIFLATKFGNLRDAEGKPIVRGDPEWVKQACHDSLERLGINQIDLYYVHRIDPTVPIEETIRAMVELKNEGKIRYLGLSECSARTLEKAHKVHPIAAAQMEFSPFALEIESEQTNFLKTARALGVKIVAYSPLYVEPKSMDTHWI